MWPSRGLEPTLDHGDDDLKVPAALSPMLRGCMPGAAGSGAAGRMLFKGYFMHSRQLLRHSLMALALLVMAPAYAADPVFPTASRIGLIPPAGFTPSTRFSGFENPQASALIALSELPADAYADVEKGFSDEALKARGWNAQLREPLTHKDGQGFI